MQSINDKSLIQSDSWLFEATECVYCGRKNIPLNMVQWNEMDFCDDAEKAAYIIEHIDDEYTEGNN